MSLAFWGAGCESGITCAKSGLSRSRGRLGDLIGDIAGAMLSAILLRMATISWSEIVCCAMVEFQKELFEVNTRYKTGFGTKMLDPSPVAFYSKRYKSEIRNRKFDSVIGQYEI